MKTLNEQTMEAIHAKPGGDAWLPVDENTPVNESVLIYLPGYEHYGPPIYRAILVDMGTGRRWHVTALGMGRDLDPRDWPKWWQPLPAPPKDET